MSGDRAPLLSHGFAAAACASAGVAGGAGPLMAVGAVALSVWGLLERIVPARVPRALARAVDLVVASTVVFLLIVRPGGLPEALRLSAQAVIVGQLSRVLRRKHRRDVMAIHGLGVVHLAIGAFLTRADAWFPWFAVCAVLGTAASVGLVSRSTGAAGETRVLLAEGRPRGKVAAGLVQTASLLAVLALLGGTLFVFLPRSPAFATRETLAARTGEPDPTDYSKDVEEGEFRITGFSARVRLGDVGRIKQAPWPAFVVQITDLGDPVYAASEHLYFRGRTLDSFDGRGWSSSLPDRSIRLSSGPRERHPAEGAEPGDGEPLLLQEFVLRPTAANVLFALDRPCWIGLDRDLPEVVMCGDGTFRAPAPLREGLTYRTASSRFPPAGGRAHARWPPPSPACLALPPVSDRLVLAARSAAREGHAEDRARRIAEWLRARCEYTLAFVEGVGRDPVDDFLFESRAGHCEYFATALAILLRAAEIPSRLVVGYRGGQWLADEEAYLLRQSDAHAWVEAFAGDRGWFRLDATPGDDRAVRVPPSRLPGAAREEEEHLALDLVSLVRGFGPEERARMIRGAGRLLSFAVREGVGIGRPSRPFPPPLPAATGGILALLLLRRILRRRKAVRGAPGAPRGRDGRGSFYAEALRQLHRRGLHRAPPQTPREFEEAVGDRLGEQRAILGAVTRAFEDARYGGRPPGTESLALLRSRARGLGRRPEGRSAGAGEGGAAGGA